MRALALAIALAAAAGSSSPGWFRAVQYTQRTVALRGCADCEGEPDDLCEVRAGALSAPLDEYAEGRWLDEGRLRLLRPRAESDCAVPAKGLLGPRGLLELAAVRSAAGTPSAALWSRAGAGVSGWPRAPVHRRAEPPGAPPGAALPSAPPPGPRMAANGQALPRSSLHLSLVCWPAEQGWPQAPALSPRNLCEWWLLPFGPDLEPEPGATSYPLRLPAFAAGEPRQARAFERSLPLDETALRELTGDAASPEGSPRAAGPREERLAIPASSSSTTQAIPASSSTTLAIPSGSISARAPPASRCGEAARTRAATLERFDQWDAQIRRGRRSSLDRGALALDASAWAGHCQELDVLRAALEEQLGCKLELRGSCAGPARGAR